MRLLFFSLLSIDIVGVYDSMLCTRSKADIYIV